MVNHSGFREDHWVGFRVQCVLLRHRAHLLSRAKVGLPDWLGDAIPAGAHNAVHGCLQADLVPYGYEQRVVRGVAALYRSRPQPIRRTTNEYVVSLLGKHIMARLVDPFLIDPIHIEERLATSHSGHIHH